MTRMLVDSSVLIYAVDSHEVAKAAIARAVLDRVRTRGGCLSTQAIGEFVRISSHRLREPLGKEETIHLALAYCRTWPVLTIDPLVTVEALRGFNEHGLAWWDAQLWATARMNGVPVVLSEDFDDGRVIDGVCFVDPFAPHFDIQALLD